MRPGRCRADMNFLPELLLDARRTRLRGRREDDALPTFRLLGGEERILRWLTTEGPRSVAEARELPWCLRNELGLELRLALADAATDALLGGASLRAPAGGGGAEIGYWIGVPFQGRGHGTEAVGLLAHLAFGDLGLGILTARVADGNAASTRVLVKAGFRPTISRPDARGRLHHHHTLLASDLRAPEPLARRVLLESPSAAE